VEQVHELAKGSHYSLLLFVSRERYCWDFGKEYSK
jgi:hypothetical protein